MKTKAYTDIQQSQELSKFLHTDTADMYRLVERGKPTRVYIDFGELPTNKGYYLPCWSLDALMELLPETVTVIDKEDEEDYTDYILCIIKEDGQWTIYYEEEAHSALAAEWLVDKTSENLLDAAYNIIVELHNKGLL